MSEIKLDELRFVNFQGLGANDGVSLRASRTLVDPVFCFLQFKTVLGHQSRLSFLQHPDVLLVLLHGLQILIFLGLRQVLTKRDIPPLLRHHSNLSRDIKLEVQLKIGNRVLIGGLHCFLKSIME